MNDDTPRNVIEPNDGADRQADGGQNAGASNASADRGMPALGQYRGARPRAWWLTPIVIVLIVGVGAVWTVHGFLARHDAESKARRDSMAGTSSQGRMFDDLPASSAGSAASATVPASAIAVRPASNSGVVTPARIAHAATPHSYYDAPLLATGGGQEPAGAGPGVPGSGGAPFPLAAGVNGGAGASAQGAGQMGGGLAQALMPTVTPRVQAGTLGNRSLVLAQGAKIDCAGDTAFDSTEAGLSTCTVTKNVYSDDGNVVLIERGSQINSQYRSNMSPGQKRVFVLSARIKTPNGVTVEIDSPAATHSAAWASMATLTTTGTSALGQQCCLALPRTRSAIYRRAAATPTDRWCSRAHNSRATTWPRACSTARSVSHRRSPKTRAGSSRS